MMKNVKLDIAKTGIEISADIEAKAQTANALLHSGKGAGNDFLGWVHLPSSISENEIDAIRKEAAKLRSKADVVVCIGIGGMLMSQILINVGMCLGIMPVIGITLPFVSYGGTSMATTFMALGLVNGLKMRERPGRLR